MKAISFIIITVLLFSCGNKSAISKKLSSSDSLVIHFNTPQTNTIEKTVTTKDNKAINKLARFVNSKITEAYKCGYDGNLMFYKHGTLVGDVSFNFSADGCRHFMMLVNDNLTPTAMSNEGADFLKSLKEGKGWY